MHPNPNGERVVIPARGRVCIAPVASRRMVSFTDKKFVRFRDAIFSHNGENIYALSDDSGEFGFISLSSAGVGLQKNITKDGTILRYRGAPSLNGKLIAYSDLENNMFVLNIETAASKKISANKEGIRFFFWSPDSQWIAFVQSAFNTMTQIKIYNVITGTSFNLTTDSANSFNPQWSPNGQFIYFLSDRNLKSLVEDPWGPRQPKPFFDAKDKIYHIALKKGTRSPFRQPDELFIQEEKKTKEKGLPIFVDIDTAGIRERIITVPIKPGNYTGLAFNKKALYLGARGTDTNSKMQLSFMKIDNENVELKTLVNDISSFELAIKGNKILFKKGENYHMISAETSKVYDLSKSKINLSGWKFPIKPLEDWKQLFTDAWRMERDYFYDKNRHGVDW